MENDFVVLLNDLPIECNRKFIESNFRNLYRSASLSTDFLENRNQRSIQIKQGNDFYQVTKDIFQGNEYEITDENFAYLQELSNQIKSECLQTKLNSFSYKRECDDHQIDQHPSIQFLIEISTLIHKLSFSNYEDISTQIKQKLISNESSMSNQNKGKKSKNKNNKSKKKEEKDDNEDIDSNREEKKISLKYIDKKSLSKLFYNVIVNTLSSKFQDIKELQVHQQKIDLIIQLIKDLDSSNEEEEEKEEENDKEPNTYLNNFINYIIKKYSNIKSECSTIFNRRQETFYLINNLLTNKILTLQKLQKEDDQNTNHSNNMHKFNCPEYFLHFYPQDMVDKYFKEKNMLIREDVPMLCKSSSKQGKKKNKKAGQQINENKTKEYVENHQKKVEEGFCFDNDFLNMIINDQIDDFKNYLRKQVSEKIKANKNERKREKVNKNTMIDSYTIPKEIGDASCISALSGCSVIELAAFFGSINIYKYLNGKLFNQKIKQSTSLPSYIVLGQNEQIIKLYIDSLVKKVIKNLKNDTKNKRNSDDENSDIVDEDYENYSDYDDDDDSNNSNYREKEIDLRWNDLINPLNEMMSLCIQLHKFELYDYLKNFLLNFKNKDYNYFDNYEQLDIYTKKCISRSYFDIIPHLLKEGASTDSLLSLFCKSNNEIGVGYMLEFTNIDVNKGYFNKTPLEYCINNRNSRTALLLLNNDKIELSKDKQTNIYHEQEQESLLHVACRFGLAEIVDNFLQKKLFDVNDKTAEGIRPIHLACLSGNFETVETIVEQRKKAVKFNGKVTKGEYKGFTPLHFACISGNPKIVSFLLRDEYKIDINLKEAVKKWTPLQYAVFNGHTEVVSLLLDQSDIETDMKTSGEEETLLHLACNSNKEGTVDLLINHPNISQPFDLNAKTSRGKTPLQIALSHGNYKMVSLLLNIDVNTNSKSKKKKGSSKQSDIDPNLPGNNGKPPLIIACEMRRVDIFNLLLKHTEIDINAQLSNKKSVLYVACEFNMIDIVKTLLEYDKIEVNAATKLGKTPLIIACEKGNKEIVELLIDYNESKSKKSKSKKNKKSNENLIDFNAKTNDKKSALLISCEFLRMDIAEILVHIDEIECDDASDDGRTPLCYACEKGCEDLVTELINHGADVNHHTKDDRTPLYFACLSRNENIVRNILSKIHDYSQINLKETTNGTTPLFISCLNGDLEIFNSLTNEIEDNTDLNYNDNMNKSLLYAACKGENLEIIEKLLTKYNVDPNTASNKGKTPLHVACKKKNSEIVDLIVNHSSVPINLNAKWNEITPLELACEKGSYEIVQILIKQEGIQVNPTNKNEVPPLLCACEIWRTDIIKLLLEEVEDIDVDAAQSDGRTVLHYACEKGDVGICELILSKSDKCINSRTTDKKTPIELACKNDNVEIVVLLLKHMDDMQINAKFFDGNTILSKACIQQSVDVVKCLLENTVIDVNATNNSGKTALLIVAKNGNEQLCQMLLDHEKIDINIALYQKPPIYEACKYGNAGAVELLLKKGARADCLTKNGKTPLHVACQHGFNKVVSLLLNRPEVDVNLLTVASPHQIESKQFKTFYSPLHIACMNKNFYSISSSRNNNNNQSGRRPFWAHRYTGNDDDDNDYTFNSSRRALANAQLCVELLIHHPQIDINLQTSKNETALTIACQNHKYDLIKTLLQSPQIDPNVKGSYDNTALHIACQQGQADLVQMLLNNQKTQVNYSNINDETPLSISCDRNRIDIVKLLLNREDLVVFTRSQYNPIRNAIQKNNSELFSILLHHPSFKVNQLDANSVTPLGYSINSQNIDFIRQLLFVQDIDVNKKFCITKINNNSNRRFYNQQQQQQQLEFTTPLNYALKLDNYQIAKMLIQSPDLNANEYIDGKTTLQSSIISNNHKITSLLLSSSNIDPNLITTFDPNSITLIVNERYSYNSMNQTNDPYLFGLSSLHIACQEHNVTAVKELIKHEDLLVNLYTNADDLTCLDTLHANLYDNYKTNKIAKIQAQKANRGTRMHYYNDDEEIAKFEDTKLSVRFENDYKNGCNALYIACSENQPEIVSLMLNRSDIDLNAKSTNDELTPLHIAVKKGYLKIVELLLSDERCDADVTSKDGTNILNFACQSHNIELLKMILTTRKSLLNSKNVNGDTPLHYVCRSNDSEILTILLNEADQESFDINVRNENGDTPLHYAAKHDVPERLYRIPKKNSFNNDDNDNDNNYNYIDEYKTKTVFGILLDNGADYNASNLYGQTPLYFACQSQCYNNINILLQLPDILIDGPLSDNKSTPLVALMSSAIELNYKDPRLSKDEDSNKMNNQPFSNRFGRFSNFGGFNDDDDDIQVRQCHMNIPNGLIRTVNKMLDHGANYKVANEDGISLLHFGIICRSKKLVEFVFNKTKDDDNELQSILNYHSIFGDPINLAIDNWSSEVMPLLCQRKKMIKFSDENRDEIIYKAAFHNDPYSILLLLLKNKDEQKDPNLEFNVNYCSDKNNNTPLHIAANKQSPISVCILANYSETELNVLNSKGKSALHEACISADSITIMSILTKVDLKDILNLYKKYKVINNEVFRQFLKSKLSSLNDRIDINLATKGMTRREFFRRERQKILEKDPTVERFHIYYNEPRFNIGFTALHICISRQILDVVEKILKFPKLDINAYSEHGDTAASIAAKNWNENIVLMLLDYPGINLNFVSKDDDEYDDGYDDYGNHKKPEDEEPDPNRPAHTLTSEEIYEIKRKKRNQNRTLLHAACQMNSIEIAKRLLKMSEEGIFDINGVDGFDGMAPLHYICQNGSKELLDLFIDYEKKHPDVIDWNIKNKNGMTPLHFAARAKQTDIVNILINNEIVCPHVDINAVATGEFENGRTPISFACEKGLLDIVKLLLDDKSDEEKDVFSFDSAKNKKKVKRGALCGAQSTCNLEIKAQGAHQKGMTPLHYACKGTSVELVKMLLDHGGLSVINTRANGKSCLFLACKHNRFEIVKLLLEQKDIDLNIKTPRGLTPLMIAAIEGRKAIVELLLRQRKIDVNALTVDGQNAKGMAKNQDIIDLFDRFA